MTINLRYSEAHKSLEPVKYQAVNYFSRPITIRKRASARLLDRTISFSKTATYRHILEIKGSALEDSFLPQNGVTFCGKTFTRMIKNDLSHNSLFLHSYLTFIGLFTNKYRYLFVSEPEKKR